MSITVNWYSTKITCDTVDEAVELLGRLGADANAPFLHKNQRRVKRLEVAGLCTVCGVEPRAEDSADYCAACRDRRNAAKRGPERLRATRSAPAKGTAMRRVVDWLNENGPSRPRDISRGIEKNGNQVCSLLSQYSGKCVERLDDGRYKSIGELAIDRPKQDPPAAAHKLAPPEISRQERPIPETRASYSESYAPNGDGEPELAPPAPPPLQSPPAGVAGLAKMRRAELPTAAPKRRPVMATATTIAEIGGGPSAVHRVADDCAAELVAADKPLASKELARRLHVRHELVIEALNGRRFVLTAKGYDLAEAAQSAEDH